MDKKYPYGVRHVTTGTHFTVVWDDEVVKLQQTYNPPSIDGNGKISFPCAIHYVPDGKFYAEFQELSREEFLQEFPQVREILEPLEGD